MVPVLIPSFLLVITLISGLVTWRDYEISWLRWVYISAAAAAWIIFGLISSGETPVFLAVDPEIPGSLGIPQPGFIFDSISKPMLMVLSGILLVCALDAEISNRWKSWVFALGGASMLGVLAADVYTVLLSWAAIDLIWMYYDLRFIAINQSTPREMVSYAVRLLGPGLLIVPGLAGIESEFTYLLNEIEPMSAVFLVIASFFRLGVWFSSPETIEPDPEQKKVDLNLVILPSAVSVVYLIRSAAAVQPVNLPPGLVYLGGGLLILLALFQMFFKTDRSGKSYWLLGVVGLVISSLVLQQESTAVILGPLLLGTGYLLIWQKNAAFPDWIVIASAAVCLLPLPYFPGWPIQELISGGLPGIVMGGGMGLFLAGAFRVFITSNGSISESKQVSLFAVPGIAVLILTQLIVLFSSEYGSSVLLMDILPGFLMMAAAGIVGFRFYHKQQIDLDQGFLRNGLLWGEKIFVYLIGSIINKMVRYIEKLLEGSAGLLWTLLIGFLILTLITVGGGG